MYFEAKSNPAKGAPLRPGKRLRVRVDVIPGSGASVPGITAAVPQGVHECVIYAADLPMMQEQVEDQWGEWDRAVATFERRRGEFADHAVRGLSKTDTSALAVAREQAERAYRLQTEGNPEYEFRASTGRSLRKYRSVEVLADVAPEEDERAVVVRDTATAILHGLRGTSSEHAELAALRAELEALKASLGEPQSRRQK